MKINIAVVPVAGLGTRLLPATKSQPKEMLPVGRKPVVQYVVEELARGGMQRILFITGPGKASIENHFDLNAELIQVLRENGKEDLLAELSFERAPIQYFYTRQRQQLGLGHAVSCAEPFIGNQPFVVALGDSIIGLNAESNILDRMTKCFVERKAEAVIAFMEVPRDRVPYYGVAKPRGDSDYFELEDVIEKPGVDEAPTPLSQCDELGCAAAADVRQGPQCPQRRLVEVDRSLRGVRLDGLPRRNHGVERLDDRRIL